MFEQKGQIRHFTDETLNKTLAKCENDRTISIAWDILQKGVNKNSNSNEKYAKIYVLHSSNVVATIDRTIG